MNFLIIQFWVIAEIKTMIVYVIGVWVSLFIIYIFFIKRLNCDVTGYNGSDFYIGFFKYISIFGWYFARYYESECI